MVGRPVKLQRCGYGSFSLTKDWDSRILNPESLGHLVAPEALYVLEYGDDFIVEQGLSKAGIPLLEDSILGDS